MAPKRKPRATARKNATTEEEPALLLSDAYKQLLSTTLADLEAQVHERQQQLKALGEEAVDAVRQEFRIQMLNIPPSVRDMPFKVFRDQHGGDVHNVIIEERSTERRAAQIAEEPPATAQRGRRGRSAAPATVQRTTRKMAAVVAAPQPQASAAETPALPAPSTSFTPAVPGTLQRAPQLGEMFYSARGSPLGVFERDPGTRQGVLSTVLRGGRQVQSMVPTGSPEKHAMTTIIKRPQPGSKTAVPDAIVMTAKDGSNIEVDFDGGIQKLPQDRQAEVTAHLKAVGKRIDAMLGRTVTTRRR